MPCCCFSPVLFTASPLEGALAEGGEVSPCRATCGPPPAALCASHAKMIMDCPRGATLSRSVIFRALRADCTIPVALMRAPGHPCQSNTQRSPVKGVNRAAGPALEPACATARLTGECPLSGH